LFFWIVEDGEFVLYKRNGKCLSCGECCRGNLITARTTTSQDAKEGVDLPLSNWDGYSVFQVGDIWRWYKAELTNKPRICASLNGNKCDCWQTDEWPEFCRYWPFHPRDIEPFPDCGFSFEISE
jgi:Fe-S-cluster containining protein